MVSTRSARARRCAITSLPDSVLFETLQLLELKDLGSSIVAFGISKSPPLALLVDDALVSNMRLFETGFVRTVGHYGYAVANDHSDFSSALHFTVRAPCPFEARRRYFVGKQNKLGEELAKREMTAALMDAFYVHDMSVFDDARRSETCTLLSLADAEDSNPRRLLFLVSLGIKNNVNYGPGYAGRCSIAVDVLLPESDTFECLWLYDQHTLGGGSEGVSDPNYRHMSNECRLDAAVRSRLNRACGLGKSEGADLYELLETVSSLGGTSMRAAGNLFDAFDQFLEARAKYAKYCAHQDAREAAEENATERAPTANVSAESDDEEEEEDEYYDEEDGDSMIGDDGSIVGEVDSDEPGYFTYPAGPDAPKLFRWASYYGGKPEIRKQLHDWLPTIDRSSLGAVVAATQGFGARFTDDYWEQEEERMRREVEAEEFAEALKKRLKKLHGTGALAASKEPAEPPAPAPPPGLVRRFAGWLGIG